MSNRLHNNITMDDIANELGISKSTVSRALAGSGRISKETIKKVTECAEKLGFKPNLAAKALAGQKTLNIAAILPAEATSVQMMFFHECLLGMIKKTSEFFYSILVCMVEEDKTDSLESILVNRKIDGVILTQLRKNDKNVELLRNNKIPFVVIGSNAGDDVIHVDSKVQENCTEFALECLKKLPSDKNVLFVCGSLEIEANDKRLKGFMDAVQKINLNQDKYSVCYNSSDIAGCVCVGNWGLILCSDDVLCMSVFEALKIADIQVGKDVMLASFYDSVLLEKSVPSISALKIDAFNLGMKSAEFIIKELAGEKVENMNYVDCSFELRESTNI